MLLLLLVLPAVSSAAENRPLFTDVSVIEAALELDLRSLCSYTDPECRAVVAELRVGGEKGEITAIPVGFKTRGIFRLDSQNCRIPPLFLYFDTDETGGTLFQGQQVLPLTLQCKTRRTRYRDYVLKEYLAYRLHALFTPRSVRARQVRLRLTGFEHGRGVTTVDGFFTEHFEHVAERNQARVVKPGTWYPEQGNPQEVTVMAMFQYLIANTDWSVIDGHNIAYIQSPGEPVSPLPFDFDFSGLVNAVYAGPPRKLPIVSVRQRLYRGFCFEGLDWDQIYQEFIGHEPAVFDELERVAGLSDRARTDARNFLEKFFKTVESPDKRHRYIEGKCRKL